MTDTITVLPEAWIEEGIAPALSIALQEIVKSAAGARGDEKLHAYWSHGEGAAKIMWGTDGDFDRCVSHLGKYIADPEGYCAKMHKDVTGFRPGHAPGEHHSGENEGSDMTNQIQETVELSERAAAEMTKSGRMVVRAIDAGVGSTGYYSPQVLQEAAAKRLIRRGTPLHLDHPSATEWSDRPERSVQTIAAVFTGDASYNPDTQALEGEIQVFKPWRERIAEMAPYIGLSIQGAATDIVRGPRPDGKTGPIVEGLHQINSVDFVTRAGRGGKVLAILESAKIQEDEEDSSALIAAIQEAYGPALEDAGLTVGPIVEAKYTADQMKALLAKGHAIDNEKGEPSYPIDDVDDLEKAILAVGRGSGSHDKIRAYIVRRAKALGQSSKIPDNWTASGSSESGQPDNKENNMPQIQIDEAEHSRLVERAGQVTTLESERASAVQRAETAERELAEARTQLQEATNATVVNRILAEASANVELDVYQQAGIRSEAVRAEDGSVDEAKTRTAFDTAIAKLVEASGIGRPRGLGGSVGTPGGETVSEADFDAIDQLVFGDLGSPVGGMMSQEI